MVRRDSSKSCCESTVKSTAVIATKYYFKKRVREYFWNFSFSKKFSSSNFFTFLVDIWNFHFEISQIRNTRSKNRTMRPLKISVEGNIATGNKLNRLKFTHWLPLAADRTKNSLRIASWTGSWKPS